MSRLFSPSTLFLSVLAVGASIFLSDGALAAQDENSPTTAAQQMNSTRPVPANASQAAEEPSTTETTPQQTSGAPLIGPGDEIEITVYGAPDLSEHTRVNSSGDI